MKKTLSLFAAMLLLGLFAPQAWAQTQNIGGLNYTLYDITGRQLATKQDYGTPLRFDVPASGTYMVKIGRYPARKVVMKK